MKAIIHKTRLSKFIISIVLFKSFVEKKLSSTKNNHHIKAKRLLDDMCF